MKFYYSEIANFRDSSKEQLLVASAEVLAQLLKPSFKNAVLNLRFDQDYLTIHALEGACSEFQIQLGRKSF